MKRHILVPCLVLIAAIAGPMARADTLYLEDGRELKGTVTKQDESYRLVDADGKVHEFPAAKVFYVTSDDPPPPPPPEAQPPAPAETANPPAEPNESPEPTALPTDPSAETISHGEVVRPESILFDLYRKKLAYPDQANTIDRTIRKYRRLAHDKQRQANGRWLAAEDFVRAWQSFADLNAQAEAEWRKAQKALPRDNTSATAAEQKEYHSHLASAIQLQERAAQSWLDPRLRNFLLAEAARRGNKPGRAIGLYTRLVADCPDMPAFRQGYALTLLDTSRQEESLAEVLSLISLYPGQQRYTVAMLRQLMDQLDGSMANTPRYQQARKLIQTSSRTSRRQRQMAWLFPDDRGKEDAGQLPTPPADRYTIRQAVAVPAGPHRLIVPAWAVAGAEQASVRIGADTFLGVEVTRRDRRSRDPLVVLDVPGATFTPVESTALPTGQAVLADLYAANVFAEMGTTVRQFPAKLTVNSGGGVDLSAGLLPGESGGAIFHDGKLAGFLAGKTDALAETFEDRMIPGEAFRDAMEDAAKPRRKSSDETLSPRDVPGRVFLLRAFVPETFSDR